MKPIQSDIHVPEELRSLLGWLIWTSQQYPNEIKPRKVPYWTNGTIRHGQQGSPTDRERLTPFAAARDAAARMGYSGVGFAPLPDFGYTFLDFDNCVGPNGEIPAEIEQIVTRTYAEYSPSGKGIRAVLKGNLGNHKSPSTPEQFGFETFSSSGFVTFTGNIHPACEMMGLENTVAGIDQHVLDLCERRFGGSLLNNVADPDDFMAGREPKLGLSVERMQELLAVLDPSMGRDEWIRVGMALHQECDGDDTGFELWDEWSANGDTYPGTEGLRYQWDSFRAAPGKRQVTMASVIKMAKEAGGASKVPDPIRAVLPPVLAYSDEQTPTLLRDTINDIADRMSVPKDMVAIPMMIAASSVLGRRIGIRPQQNTDWTELCNLWGCVVAPPGSMKTPTASEALAPLQKLERAAAAANEALLRQYQAEEAAYNAELKKISSKGAKTQKGAPECDTRRQLADAYLSLTKPDKPRLKRYVTSDATVEKLGEICSDNPDGVMIHRDELLSLFAELDRPEKATARGFLLTGWSGKEAYTFDRISRGTTRVEAVNLSLFGTTQPTRVAAYIRDSLASFDDGMVQRLQLVAWPNFDGAFRELDVAPDEAARDRAFRCFEALANLDLAHVGARVDGDGSIPYLRFCEEAQARFKEWRIQLENVTLREPGASPAQIAHFSKYRGLIPRLALICHLANGDTGPVSLRALEQALLWKDYLESHARRLYGSLSVDSAQGAREVLRKLRAGDLPDRFTARDLERKGWGGLTDKSRVKAALDMLIERGWLRSGGMETGGRPSVVYTAHPAALEAQAE